LRTCCLQSDASGRSEEFTRNGGKVRALGAKQLPTTVHCIKRLSNCRTVQAGVSHSRVSFRSINQARNSLRSLQFVWLLITFGRSPDKQTDVRSLAIVYSPGNTPLDQGISLGSVAHLPKCKARDLALIQGSQFRNVKVRCAEFALSHVPLSVNYTIIFECQNWESREDSAPCPVIEMPHSNII
jgi:hypothetical protein